ncbi:Uncharacterized protein GBIM_08704, partial [Gryllus bimaculatus]
FAFPLPAGASAAATAAAAVASASAAAAAAASAFAGSSADSYSGGDLSSLSASLVSSDGYNDFTASLAHMFPPVLDQDLSSVGILLEETGGGGVGVGVVGAGEAAGAGAGAGAGTGEGDGSPQRGRAGGGRDGTDSGEVTPVSVSASSEFAFGADGPAPASALAPAGAEEAASAGVLLQQQKRRRVDGEAGPAATATLGPGPALASAPAPMRPPPPPAVAGPAASLKGLSKTVESMALAERRGRVGSYLGTKFVGRWVMESNENLESFANDEGEDFFPVPPEKEVEPVVPSVGLGLVGGLEPDAADEEDRTITSSMTATSPARKSIFQVFGSPVSRPLPSSVLSTSAGKESKLSTSLTPSTESDITQIEVEFGKPQSALSMSLKSLPIEEGSLASPPGSAVSVSVATPSHSPTPGGTKRPPTKTPVISAFSREFRVYSSSKAGSLVSEASLPSPSPTMEPVLTTPEEGSVSCPASTSASAPDTSSSSDALSSVRAADAASPAQIAHATMPLLTLASSLTDRPCVQRGFKVAKEPET